jgi:hypothetical protein
LQESNVVNKSGTAGFLGRAYDPYYLFPPGDDMDMNKMDKINTDDLKLRTTETRLERRARLRELINEGMPTIDKAVAKYDLNEYYASALNLILLAVNINLVAFSAYLGDLTGQVFAMFVLTVAAAEAAIGLAILVIFFRRRGSIAVDDVNRMHG